MFSFLSLRSRWLVVALAACGMVATLPGRTVGLGLITEPLLGELNLARTVFARMNLVATLLGSGFALVAGPLMDRWGARCILSLTLLVLGGLVMMMSQWVTAATITLFLILTRGVGQSALSTVSVTALCKRFTKGLAMAMGVFSVLVALGFSVAIVTAQAQIEVLGWRQVWRVLGIGIFLLGLVCAVGFRSGPTLEVASMEEATEVQDSFTLRQALGIPCFWVFSISMALYGGLLAAVSLFNESILLELGFGSTTFRYAMAGLMGAGLFGNLLAAWASKRFGVTPVFGSSLALLTLALVFYPYLQTQTQVILHASVYGFCGGVFTVLFFTSFGHTFGPKHLGKIQGVAQALAVVASALGPWWLASQQEIAGSYFPAMSMMVIPFAIVTVLAWLTRMPERAALKQP